MSEEEKLPREPSPPPFEAPQPPAEEPPAPKAPPPTSVHARIWAWVGVVYMLILVLLMTYMLAHSHYLQGIGGLMVIPALGGVAASTIYTWITGQRRDPLHAVILVLILLCCAALAVLGLFSGIPALIAGLEG